MLILFIFIIIIDLCIIYSIYHNQYESEEIDSINYDKWGKLLKNETKEAYNSIRENDKKLKIINKKIRKLKK